MLFHGSVFLMLPLTSVQLTAWCNDDVIKWKHFPRYWPFVRGFHRRQRPVTRSIDVFLICAWINGWVNNCEAGDLRRHRAHYDVIVMVEQTKNSYETIMTRTSCDWYIDLWQFGKYVNLYIMIILITIWELRFNYNCTGVYVCFKPLNLTLKYFLFAPTNMTWFNWPQQYICMIYEPFYGSIRSLENIFF